MMIWALTDANGVNCGPFADLASVTKFIKEDGNLVEPMALIQMTNGDPRPVGKVLIEAYTDKAAAILKKALTS